MKTAIYPGSFDPVTLGHLDIIERAAKLTERLIVGVLPNNAKAPLFTMEERVEILKHEVQHLPNVEVITFEGLLVDFARSVHAEALIRGLRAVTDFEYELQMSQTNRKIAPEVDTVFLTAELQYAYLSSSVVKEVAYWKGDISEFVTPYVEEHIWRKTGRN